MPYHLEIVDLDHRLEFTTATLPPRFSEAVIQNIGLSSRALHDAEALAKITLDKTAPDTYSFEIKAADGRLWKQTLSLAGVVQPTMTWSVAQPWTMLETDLIRPLRQNIVTAIHELGLTNLLVKW